MKRREFIERVARTAVLRARLTPRRAAIGAPAPDGASAPALPERKSHDRDARHRSEGGPHLKRAGRRSVLVPVRAAGLQAAVPHPGTESQLFVDNYMVEWLYDVERVMEAPAKHPEALIRSNDFRWEAFGNPLPRSMKPRIGCSR